MRYFGLTAKAVVMLFALAALSLSQPADSRGRGPGMMGGGMMGMMAYGHGNAAQFGTGLSVATRVKILDQQIDFIRNTAQLRTDLAVRQLELQELLLTPKSDSLAIDAKYAEIGRIQNDLQQAALLSNTAIAKLVPDNERGRYSLGMTNNGMMGGYGMGHGMMPGYGAGLGTPPGHYPYCAMMGTVPGSRCRRGGSAAGPLLRNGHLAVPAFGDVDRENVTRTVQSISPEPAFAGTAQLIRKAISDGWAELARRIRSLEQQ